MRDLRDQSVCMEAIQDTTDLGAFAFGITTLTPQVAGFAQPYTDVSVGEPLLTVGAVEDCTEQLPFVTGQRVERFRGSTRGALGAAGDTIELADLGGWISDHFECIEVARVGAMRDIAIANQIRDAFAHRYPFGGRFALTKNRTPHPKTVRVIDDRLDTDHASCLVVHLQPVVLDAVLDAHTGDAQMPQIQQVCDQLALELPVQFASQEAHDLPGVFPLPDHPVVGVAFEQIAEDRVDLAGIGFEDSRPVERGESIGERLRSADVFDVGEDVVDLGVADTVGVELSSQPRMAIEIDLAMGNQVWILTCRRPKPGSMK